jgi:hypothetical protein
LLTVSAIVVVSLASRIVLSALEDPPSAGQAEKPSPPAAAEAEPESVDTPKQPAAPLTEQSYAGSNECFMCHRPHTDAWSESRHAQAFNDLPQQYKSDSSCLKCHVTAFGERTGYTSGTDKDLLMVGCESCHGPGALHIDAARRFVEAPFGEEEKIEKEMRATVVKTPTDSVCIKCHVTQAHGHHPPYHGRPSKQLQHSADLAGKPAWHYPGYSIKTCGSCHYDYYKGWGSERHSAIAANLPAKYHNNQECGACHPQTSASVASQPGSDPHHGRIGAACETCHGPGLEHVQFTTRLISAPRFSPSLEQAARHSIRKGKPATSCVGCHVEESHKQHPEYEKK